MSHISIMSDEEKIQIAALGLLGLFSRKPKSSETRQEAERKEQEEAERLREEKSLEAKRREEDSLEAKRREEESLEAKEDEQEKAELKQRFETAKGKMEQSLPLFRKIETEFFANYVAGDTDDDVTLRKIESLLRTQELTGVPDTKETVEEYENNVMTFIDKVRNLQATLQVAEPQAKPQAEPQDEPQDEPPLTQIEQDFIKTKKLEKDFVNEVWMMEQIKDATEKMKDLMKRAREMMQNTDNIENDSAFSKRIMEITSFVTKLERIQNYFLKKKETSEINEIHDTAATILKNIDDLEKRFQEEKAEVDYMVESTKGVRQMVSKTGESGSESDEQGMDEEGVTGVEISDFESEDDERVPPIPPEVREETKSGSADSLDAITDPVVDSSYKEIGGIIYAADGKPFNKISDAIKIIRESFSGEEQGKVFETKRGGLYRVKKNNPGISSRIAYEKVTSGGASSKTPQDAAATELLPRLRF